MSAPNVKHDSIGVFDSGLGGLTVVRELETQLPHEPIVYLGDTARVPYGTKSPETVIRYAEACARILLERGMKLLVVACNTASAQALDTLRDTLDIPVLGVIEPGARAAVDATRNGRIGVIGTSGTMASRAYPLAIEALAPDMHVYTKACPLFVPLVEEGWTHGSVPRDVAKAYLAEFMDQDIDTLVLGCTHYPLLAQVIRETMGDGVTLVDSAAATAAVVVETLDAMGIRRARNAKGRVRYLVSDSPDSFSTVGQRFLGHDIGKVEWVDF